MSQNDPTDHALAAIASILDQPEPQNGSRDRTVDGEPDIADPEGYCRFGPGPIPAMRFKWTVRRENADDYFVDETIGDQSRPITTGPMSSSEAVRFVDDLHSETERRFQVIKNEMSGHRTSE